MKRILLAFTLGLLALAGCGSGGQTISIPSPEASEAPPPTETTTTAAATPSSTYPVVHFTTDAAGIPEPNGEWPFTLQIVSLTTSPEGFLGPGSEPPGWTWLMMRVNITSQSPGRTPPSPELKQELACSGPGSTAWNPLTSNNPSAAYGGYELDPESPTQLTLATESGLSYGVPQTYGAEWQVPENIDISQVQCELGDGSIGEESTLELT